MKNKIRLYGAGRCHKTQLYKSFFEDRNLDYKFIDVEESSKFAEELRNLYSNRKLNFPTITINTKRLRNPSEKELLKWIQTNV
ncbi:MAG: glutaredoxin family protein [Psychroserpens sp.]|nr:glutaredoxin family protein [Psychroserpens sp.]